MEWEGEGRGGDELGGGRVGEERMGGEKDEMGEGR